MVVIGVFYRMTGKEAEERHEYRSNFAKGSPAAITNDLPVVVCRVSQIARVSSVLAEIPWPACATQRSSEDEKQKHKIV
jgi:hypothetical protein